MIELPSNPYEKRKIEESKSSILWFCLCQLTMVYLIFERERGGTRENLESCDQCLI